MSILIHWFIDPVDPSWLTSTVDKDSLTGEYGRYWRSMLIHLRRITVDCQWQIKNRDNFVKGLNVIAENRQIDRSISSIQASKSQKRDFRNFSETEVCYSNGNVKFENFMYMEWSEEKFLKGIVGEKTRIRFRNKHQKMELYSQSWRATIECIKECWSIKKQYQKNWIINKIYQDMKLIWFFLLAHIYSLPAAWAKDLSSDAYFRSIASFGDPHYLSTTSPHSF